MLVCRGLKVSALFAYLHKLDELLYLLIKTKWTNHLGKIVYACYQLPATDKLKIFELFPK